MTRPWLNRLVLPAGVLVIYFVFPDGADAPVGMVLGALLAVLGVAAIGWVIFDEVRRAEKRLQPVHLLVALELVVVIFSLAYYWVSSHMSGEFAGLHTRLDALYFSLTTVATVGYGDVSASGQLARALVSIQLVFNLIFVATLVSLFQGRLGTRAERGGTP